MSDFYQAIPVVLAHEGGFSCDPADAGGATNYGISARMLISEKWDPAMFGLADFSPESMKKLSIASAKSVYKSAYWDKGGYGAIVDQTLATKIFDFGVNAGLKRAAILAQKACNVLGASLVVDGQLGPKSFAAINSFPAKDVINAYGDQQLEFYNGLVAAKPSQAKFLPGWTKRANWGR